MRDGNAKGNPTADSAREGYTRTESPSPLGVDGTCGVD